MDHVKFLTGGEVPNSISVDYERAAINAERTVYRDTDDYGGFFHLWKKMYKRVQENGLSTLYLADQLFCTNIRMICAMAFVPVANIRPKFRQTFSALWRE